MGLRSEPVAVEPTPMPPAPRRLLLVCSGNICRTPMAVWVARQRSVELGIDLEVDSAGTLGIEGAAPDRRAMDVVAELDAMKG